MRRGIVARGRNYAHDPAGALDTRARYPLQGNRLAHAELNAIAGLPIAADHGALILWTTQHPRAMCTAAIAFVGIGAVRSVADDPSDHDPPERIVECRVWDARARGGDPLRRTVANLLLLYNSAVQRGANAGNLRENRDHYPALVALGLDLAATDVLGFAARSGISLVEALAPHGAAINRATADAPGPR